MSGEARTHRGGVLVLLAVTAVWGFTFPAMKAMGASLDALEIMVFRYAVSSLAFLPIIFAARRSELRWGVLIGSVLFVAFYLQVKGLGETTSNRNAFVTGLNVIFVPILARLWGQRLGLPIVIGAVITLAGMAGLFYDDAPWSRGDTLTLVGAVAYGFYVLTFDFSARAQPVPRPDKLAAVQSYVMLLLSGAAASLGMAPAQEPGLWERAWPHLPVLIFLGLVAGALVTWAQAWAQHRVRAVEAALIYGLEPVFASLLALWWIGEILGPRAILGAGLIVIGVMVSQFTATWPIDWQGQARRRRGGPGR